MTTLPPPAPMTSPGTSTLLTSSALLEKHFGLTPSQVGRAKVLSKMGVTEEDLVIASKIMAQMPPEPTRRGSTKVENLLGFDMDRIKRARALKRLGVSEDQLDVENAKNLGSLGIDARKRSFLLSENSGGRMARSASEPVITANGSRKRNTGKRGSWFSRRSSVSNGSGASGRGSLFEGWNCAGGGISKDVIIGELQRVHLEDQLKISELKEAVSGLQKELSRMKQGGMGEADAGAGGVGVEGVAVAVEEKKGIFGF